MLRTPWVCVEASAFCHGSDGLCASLHRHFTVSLNANIITLRNYLEQLSDFPSDKKFTYRLAPTFHLLDLPETAWLGEVEFPADINLSPSSGLLNRTLRAYRSIVESFYEKICYR